MDQFSLPAGTESLDRTGVRAGWAISTAHTYGYSISPEGGIAAGVTGELVRRAFGSSGDASTFTADLRAYIPGASPHHVIAIRSGGGVSTGERSLQRVFRLGGSAPAPDVLDFGRDVFAWLRGFPVDTFAGSRVAAASVEYRWPVLRIQRGFGTWPIFLHTMHAAAFADAGHAWTRSFQIRDAKTSAGAELSFDLALGYSAPLTTSIGAAWRRDGSGHVAGGAAYVRIGRAF